MQANEMQVGGQHYQSEYQHWDFVQDALMGLYLEGQITKYISRWRKKNGIQDLEKALHFTRKLYEIEADPLGKLQAAENVSELVDRFCVANGIDLVEGAIIMNVATWEDKETLARVMGAIQSLIDRNTRPL